MFCTKDYMKKQQKFDRVNTVIALLIAVFIPFGIMIWYRSYQTYGFTPKELIESPLLFGMSSILAIYLLKRYLLNETVQDFNSGKGKWLGDIVWGVVLTAIYFTLFVIERQTLANWLTFAPNMELLGLMLEMRKDYLMLILWFGPVLWIGIALYEELIRVFLLTSFWKFSTNKNWVVLSVFITSLLIGLTHFSQGSYGIVSITIKSLVMCVFYYKYRRILPLIISHALYDGIQVAMLMITHP